MARWGKSIAVPLDTLIKEKENTNRPTAARSAGTVGKWGKMGFTSTRTYALKALPPVESPDKSPEAVGDYQLPLNNDPPKPRKFFKSRNTSVEVRTQFIQHLPRAPPSPIRSEGNSPPKKDAPLKLKISKMPMERKKSTSSDRPNKPKKKKEEKKLKPEAPPSRIISRTRKIVNYNEEDDERSQTPLRDIIQRLSPVPVRKESPPPVPSVMESDPRSPLTVLEPPIAVKSTPIEHPPIVLRISKGTSRLVSTDSEDILNSPPHEPPLNETSAPIAKIEPSQPSTDSLPKVQDLRIVLKRHDFKLNSEQTSESPDEISTEPPKAPTPEESSAKLESLKIVIKASVLEKTEKKERRTRKHHKSVSSHKLSDHTFKTPSPQPGSENYDLYRTLTGSPSERDFDSQSSILGSVSSKENSSQFPLALPDESCVIRSRGSSDITSDIETSQHSSLVALPSDIESRLESMMDGEDDDPSSDRAPDTRNTVDRLNTISEEPLKEDILEVLTGGGEGTISSKEQQSKDMIATCSSKVKKEAGEVTISENPVNKTPLEREVIINAVKKTRAKKGEVAKLDQPAIATAEIQKQNSGRVTRNNNNGNAVKQTLISEPASTPLTSTPSVRSYGRRCKVKESVPSQPESAQNYTIVGEASIATQEQESSQPEDIPIDLPDAPIVPKSPDASSPVLGLQAQHIVKEYKIKNKMKRAWEASKSNESDEVVAEPPLTKSKTDSPNESNSDNRNAMKCSNRVLNNNTEIGENDGPLEDEKRSVKLVISKKKGSIFKSRALVTDQGNGTKRHIYKHTWEADREKSQNPEGSTTPTVAVESTLFDDEDFNDEEEGTSKIVRTTRQNSNKFENDSVVTVKCDRKAKEYYTVVRNVKTAHQIQEIGEYQEMDDDVEYILDALQPHNPISTRCLSALQLASKCMTPAFRMHVRAHGTATKFFKALKDAKKDLSLSLCTATIMFVLSQDTLNMDLDRESLELMLNLLESNGENTLDEYGMINFERNKQRVKELCEEIKNQGKAAHFNIDSISAASLAMETLLSLTSKRAGEWFKEELRNLGGLEHIIKTICECCHQISDYVVSWTEVLLDKLKTIERCLRVLENVSELDQENQEYILTYKDGDAIDTLFRLYKLCDSEIALYPTVENTPKEHPGVVIREALVPTLKVLINLTHPFNQSDMGSKILGQRAGIFDTSFHILLQAPNYVPERCIFELNILVLYLLINLTMYTVPNRTLIMKSHAPCDFGNPFVKVPAIKALIEYFYKCEEQARMAEENTNAILENPSERNKKSQEELEETVTKLLQKAGHHMEHTMKASYAGLLIGYLIYDSADNEKVIRTYLNDNSFKDIINILEKYYNFVNLTANNDATSHIKSTRKLIDYFKKCETQHSINTKSEETGQSTSSNTSSSSMMTTRNTPRVYKNYSQR